jgi:heat shock protein HslJ
VAAAFTSRCRPRTNRRSAPCGARRAPVLALLLSTALNCFAQSALEGRWIAEDAAALGGAKMDPPPRVTLVIRKDRLAAGAGCNSANAPIENNGQRIKVGPLVTTMMACPAELSKLEKRYFGMLERDPSFTLAADTLTLASGGDTLTFTRAPGPGPGASRKLIQVAAERKDCVGVAPMKCLQVRAEQTDPWTLYYGEIVGFTPTPGVEYRLRVLEETVPNPAADASAKRWYLDQVIEQMFRDGGGDR